MPAQLITLPLRPVINTRGTFESGALLDVFQAGTTTRIQVFSDAALTTPLTNPVVADSSATFPPVYYNDSIGIRIRIRRADGSVLPNGDIDPYPVNTATAEAARDLAQTYAGQSLSYAGLSQAWATGTLPGGVGTKSAREFSVDASGFASAAANDRALAQAAASTAVLSPGTNASSTTSNTVGTGSKSWTIETGKAFTVGQFVVVSRTSAPANFMFGQITAFNSGTGAITVNVTGVGGAGTFTDWTVALSGPAGSLGVVDITTGTSGTLGVARGGTGATTAAAARTALGSTTVGDSLFTLTNPSAVTFLRLNADNTVTTRTAAQMLTDLGAAALASPVFTGNPTAPTPAALDNDTSIATTAFVQAELQPTVLSVASTLTLTPDASLVGNDGIAVTALAANMTIAAPTGTPVEMRPLIIRIKDNGTVRTLSWNAIYRPIQVTLPTATVATKTLYVGFLYNATDTKWDCVFVRQEA